ncbi:hypothetical protein KDJ56_17605 [Brevibacillus composti]|uniref:Lipoprotein n=1 Tax=Brevibacillus composti TaxID=2796470 RepID=A0A7T5EJF2_9BACL|nr:hypothetical protein [Brevibacillus composti]QQE73691.1 hypothetical protein JD108_17665 [Brevibacillus composti]QUO40774.1 hypothetical protein KDJ56_17605 [Brevibacillus composti]
MKSNPFALALAGIMAIIALGCSAPTSSPSSKPTGKEEPPHENVMRLGRNEGTGVNRETLLVLHTDDLRTAEGKETTGNWQDHSIFNGEISLPILNYAWKDAFTLEVTFPKIDSASYEEIRKWMNTEGGQQQTLAVRYE